MYKRTIKIELSTASVNAAIAELNQLAQDMENKTRLLNERLAILGTSVASSKFGAAIYDGDNDVELSAEPTADGWQITASGRAVFFIEFGAGVHHNTGEPYPEPRPEGIVGIGEYGKGHGKQQAWAFYDSNGDKVITYGNPAAMPMFFAKEEIMNRFREIAQEVFS